MITNRELCQITDDYNNDKLYSMFNEDTDMNLEFEIDQSYGTECYGIVSFTNGLYKGDYPTLEELEKKIQNYKSKIGTENIKYSDDIALKDIVNYFRRKGILPEKDFLFNIDY